MFRGCKTEDMPPHVYSQAQTAYRAVLETRRDQSLIFMGRSASGKTTSFKHALYYLTLAAGSVNKLLTAEKVNAINTILESFGNTKTCMNSNATRFTQIMSLDFDHTGQIASASVQVCFIILVFFLFIKFIYFIFLNRFYCLKSRVQDDELWVTIIFTSLRVS